MQSLHVAQMAYKKYIIGFRCHSFIDIVLQEDKRGENPLQR